MPSFRINTGRLLVIHIGGEVGVNILVVTAQSTPWSKDMRQKRASGYIAEHLNDLRDFSKTPQKHRLPPTFSPNPLWGN